MPSVSPKHFLQRIEEHFQQCNLDVVVRKRGHGYSIRFADDGEPLARLLPDGQGDRVELRCWKDDQWEPLGEFGTVLPLNEALQRITTDPEALLLGGHGDEDRPERKARAPKRPRRPDKQLVDVLAPVLQKQRNRSRNWTLRHTLTGAVLGGLCGSPLSSAAVGFAGCSVFLYLRAWWTKADGPVVILIPLASAVAIHAGLAATVGSSIAASLVTAEYAPLCGAVLAAGCGWAISRRPWLAWTIAFLAGVWLGLQLADLTGLQSRLGATLLASLLAMALASFCYHFQAALCRSAKEVAEAVVSHAVSVTSGDRQRVPEV